MRSKAADTSERLTSYGVADIDVDMVDCYIHNHASK